VRAGSRAEGGSTLTQQLARTLFLSNVRTFGRKAKEAGIAVLIEQQLTKNQILELYLNRVYLSAGVYGAETMAEHLFRKPARMLTLPEAALIAALIRAPSTLSPWSNYDGALERSHTVLAEMRQQGFITAQQEEAARRVQPPFSRIASRAIREPRGRGLPDASFRASSAATIRRTGRCTHPSCRRRRRPSGRSRAVWPPQPSGLQAALVAIDPSTESVALVGGGDYQKSTFNRAIRSRRQPGSAFKPIVFAAALARGYSPVSVLSSLDRVSVPGDREWSPRNAEGDLPAELTLRAALIESNNAAAAELQQKIGVRTVLSVADDAGLAGLPEVPSLALGTGLVTPLDLTAAFTCSPAEEIARLAASSTCATTRAGVRAVSAKRVVGAEVISDGKHAADVIDRGTGSPARALGCADRSANRNDRRLSRCMWWLFFFGGCGRVGRFRSASADRPTCGARGAMIWADFMKRVSSWLPPSDFVVPADLQAEGS
jgi:penicillin-binding protein 1A